MDLKAARRMMGAAALLCWAATLPGAAAAAPSCEAVSPSNAGWVALAPGQSQAFRLQCSDADGDLEWEYLDADTGAGIASQPAQPTPETGQSFSASHSFSFPSAGDHWVKGRGTDKAGNAAVVAWSVYVPPPGGTAPLCQRVSPGENLTLPRGAAQAFQFRCEDRDGDLDKFELDERVGQGWSVVAWSFGPNPRPAGFGSQYSQSFPIDLSGSTGRLQFQGIGIDAAGHRSAPVWWNVTIPADASATTTTRPTAPTTTTTTFPTTPKTPTTFPTTSRTIPPGGDRPTPVSSAPVGEDAGSLGWLATPEGLTAAAGAVIGIGTLVLGFVKVRRRIAEGGEGEGDGGGPPPAPAGVTQSVQGNSGTVVGTAGTVIVEAPRPAPAPQTPPGVPPRKQGLYLALDEARDILDAPEAGAQVVNARDMVQGLLEDLRVGETPMAAARRAAAQAIRLALEGTPAERIQRGRAALQRACEELER